MDEIFISLKKYFPECTKKSLLPDRIQKNSSFYLASYSSTLHVLYPNRIFDQDQAETKPNFQRINDFDVHKISLNERKISKDHIKFHPDRYSKVLNRTNCYFESGSVKEGFSFTKQMISLTHMDFLFTHAQSGPVEAEIWQFVLSSILLYSKYSNHVTVR